MTVFEPDPSLKWLFCMTHPDDEISICGWMSRVAAVNPERVWVSWTHRNPVREVEARSVANQLGLREDHLFFHEGIDGEVCTQMGDLKTSFAEMMQIVQPDRVVCGAFEQGHLDHDATNFLVNGTFHGVVCEVPFYHTYRTKLPRVNRFADASNEEVIDLTSQERELKRTIAHAYPSQAIWKNMVFAEIRARLTGDGSLLATEHMRIQTHKDFRIPNLPEPLAAKVERTWRWKKWRASLDALTSD